MKITKNAITMIILNSIIVLAFSSIYYAITQTGLFHPYHVLEYIAYPAFWLFTNKMSAAGLHLWYFDFYGIGWILAIAVSSILIWVLFDYAKKLSTKEQLSVKNGLIFAALLYVTFSMHYLWIASFPDTSFSKYDKPLSVNDKDLSKSVSTVRFVFAEYLYKNGKVKEAYAASAQFAVLKEYERLKVENKLPDNSTIWVGDAINIHKQYAKNLTISDTE